MRKERRWKLVALLAAGMAIGVTMAATPVGAHVADWTHNWNTHIKPKADVRYYTKAQSNTRYLQLNSTLRAGQTLTGVWGGAGGPASGTGFIGATIAFKPKLPANIPSGNVHYVGSANANCPGPGQAAAGHLCIYESWAFGASFSGWGDPASANASGDVTPQGVFLFFDSSSVNGNARGTWAVQPASSGSLLERSSARPASPAMGETR